MPRFKRAASSGLAGSQPAGKVARRDGGNSRYTSSQPSAADSSFSSSILSHRAPPSSLVQSSQWNPGAGSFDDPLEVREDDDTQETPLEFYGTMDNKIVGVRYYDGIVTPGESILCRRERTNAYDRNAVRVDNIMGSQVGHLPRNLVEKLAPYMDRREIMVDGVLNGHKGPFDCPIRLYFYGTSDPIARLELEAKLKADKLVKATELKATRKEAEAQRAIAQDPTNGAPALGLGVSEYGQAHQEVLEDSEAVNFRAELGALDVLNMDETTLSAMPQAKQPDAVKSQLLVHQLQVRRCQCWLNCSDAC